MIAAAELPQRDHSVSTDRRTALAEIVADAEGEDSAAEADAETEDPMFRNSRIMRKRASKSRA